MARVLAVLTLGVILGGLARPAFDGAYWDWRYSDMADADPSTWPACYLAEVAPTDSNLDACYGPMI